jgi:hypothetical protein
MRSLISAGSEGKSSNLAGVKTSVGDFSFSVKAWRASASFPADISMDICGIITYKDDVEKY